MKSGSSETAGVQSSHKQRATDSRSLLPSTSLAEQDLLNHIHQEPFHGWDK